MRSCLMNKLPVVLFLLLIFSGCQTAGKAEIKVDYSDSRSVLYEVELARQVLNTDPLQALLRSRILQSNTSGYQEVEQIFVDSSREALAGFRSAVQLGNWNEALVFYRSLQACELSPADWNEEKLKTARVQSWQQGGNDVLAALENIQSSTPQDEAPSPLTVARMIQGTVTVWVDRGLRIENGVGYADRVIGSGFFIDSRGYLVTNYHVISSEVDPTYEGYSRLFIKLPNDPSSRIPARVIGWDPVLDLALVKTEINPSIVFSLGTSRELSVGNRIYAIGSPAGLEQTLTSGIVSAKNRRLLSLGDVLQIDAPINHGNSGGPIVDEAGRVQAVVFAGIETYEGLNFAIPVELLRIILPSLYNGGLVTHSWLSAWGQTVAADGAGRPAGVLLVYTVPGSSMDIAGIPQGTIITALNGRRVNSLEELQYALLRELPGTLVRLEGVSPANEEGKTETITYIVRLESRPLSPAERILEKDTESRSLLPLFGLDLERTGTKRFIVKSVVRGSIADESGFSEQDYIEIRELTVDKTAGGVILQVFTKRRKSGYLDAFIGLGTALDSPSYF